MADPVSGHGATISFGGDNSAFAGCYTTIGGHERTVEILDTTCLNTTPSRTKTSGDVIDEGGMELELFFDPTVALPILGVAEEVTLTYPISSPPNQTNATFIGDAIITSHQLPSPTTDELMSQTIHLEWTKQPAFAVEEA